MTTTVRNFSISIRTAMNYDRTLAKLREALRSHGLETLCELPVDREVERQGGVRWSELGLHWQGRYTILVVWSPSNAHQALLCDRDGALLIPFTFSVAEDRDFTVIAVTNHYAAMNPRVVTIGVQVLVRDLARKVRDVLGEFAGQEQQLSVNAMSSRHVYGW